MKRYFSRNGWLFLLQGAFFCFGYAFFDASNVLPVYVEKLTGSLLLSSIPYVLKLACSALGQLSFGMMFLKKKNIPRYLGFLMMASYSSPILAIVAILLDFSDLFIAIAVIVSVFCMWMFEGSLYIGFYDTFGRTMGSIERGRVSGLMQGAGGILALVGAFVVRLILNTDLPLNTQYLIIFALAAFILIFSYINIFFCKVNLIPNDTVKILGEYKKLPQTLKGEKTFLKIEISQIFFFLATISVPVSLVICNTHFHYPDTLVNNLYLLQVLGIVLGGLIGVFITPKLGTMNTIRLFAAAGLGSAVFGFFAILSGGNLVLTAIMILCGGITLSSWVGYINGVLDLANEENMPRFILLNSIFSFPFAFVYLCPSYLISWLGIEGFFLLCAAFGVISILALIGVKKRQSENKDSADAGSNEAGSNETGAP